MGGYGEEPSKITERVIGCTFRVGNELGNGFLEKVYENALAHEMGKAGLRFEQQKQIDVIYDGIVVGQYAADFVVENQVILELKVVKMINEIYMAQCLNYLKAANLKICLLINFAKPKVEIKRIVY